MSEDDKKRDKHFKDMLEMAQDDAMRSLNPKKAFPPIRNRDFGEGMKLDFQSNLMDILGGDVKESSFTKEDFAASDRLMKKAMADAKRSMQKSKRDALMFTGANQKTIDMAFLEDPPKPKKKVKDFTDMNGDDQLDFVNGMIRDAAGAIQYRNELIEAKMDVLNKEREELIDFALKNAHKIDFSKIGDVNDFGDYKAQVKNYYNNEYLDKIRALKRL
ncbi:hypothetical protein LCGC14_0804810 [marine sediment metagenome]|uniref:Uncharacterized protein n=1 Tax=marine sediment metagenome TaxID=412755 RepID=A0A0F9SVV9_9ZZZZ